jgi:hypothetical protein
MGRNDPGSAWIVARIHRVGQVLVTNAYDLGMLLFATGDRQVEAHRVHASRLTGMRADTHLPGLCASASLHQFDQCRQPAGSGRRAVHDDYAS